MNDILRELGIDAANAGVCSGIDSWLRDADGAELPSINPTTNETIATVIQATAASYDQAVAAAQASFEDWRLTPAPKRGEVIRDLGEALRRVKEPLGALVTLENGKIRSEGLGEVQEMIDICDFAVGLSRQLYGLTMHSERPGHRMYEQWHPLGPIGIITAFNFPVAVWSWNAAIAAVCGDTMIWKPSPNTPLTALAVQHICNQVMAKHGVAGVFNLVIGEDETVGERMINDAQLHRLGPHRQTCGAAGRSAPAPLHPGAGRQQRHHRQRRCRPGSGRPRHRLRRGRHGGPALHHDAPLDRRALDCRRA